MNMNKINFKYIRLSFLYISISLVAFLSSQVFFLVTNSNLNDFIPVNQTSLSFENNILEELDWDYNGTSNWIMNNEESYSGEYSLKSGQITHDEYSLISLTIDIYEDGYVDFWYLVDSEYSTSGNYFYDGLQFFIDGDLQGEFQPDTDGEANWNYIRELKNERSIPIIGNGDVKSINDYHKMINYTKCDAVMIGRAALGNPWIFSEIRDDNRKKPTKKDIAKICSLHLDLLIKYYNKKVSLNLSKKHFGWYLKGFEGASNIRKEIMRSTKVEEVQMIIDELLRHKHL